MHRHRRRPRPRLWSRLAIGVVAAGLLLPASPAYAGPVTDGFIPGQERIDATLQYGSETYHLHLEHVSVRGSDFEVRVQQADGTFANWDAPASATYIGTVEEDSGGWVTAAVMADGSLVGDMFTGRGQRTFSFEGNDSGGPLGAVYDKTAQQPTWHWPDSSDPANNVTVGPGDIARNPISFNLAVDVNNGWFTADRGGESDIATTLAKVEANVVMATALYEMNLNWRPLLGRVVIRADAGASPYPTNGATPLSTIRTEWRTNQSDSMWSDVVLLDDPGFGGVAYVGSVGGSYGLAQVPYYGGRNAQLLRHEVGHTLEILDNQAGHPEGPTVYVNNNGRFDGTEVASSMRYKNGAALTRRSILPSPPVSAPLPPYAALDLVDAVSNTTSTLDVLANDFDVNQQGIAGLELTRVDATSALGGTLQIVGGKVTYTAPAVAVADTLDSFTYTTTDPSGQTGEGVVLLHIDPSVSAAGDDTSAVVAGQAVTIDPLANDTSGSAAALDPTTLRLVGADGPTDAVTVDGVGSWRVDPATGTVTFTALSGTSGSAAIEYQVADAAGVLSTATITVTVTAAPATTVPGNDPASATTPTSGTSAGAGESARDGSAGDGLANTGGDIAAGPVAFGLGATLLGAALLLVIRRRSVQTS